MKGSYGTKLEAVVARLISLTRASATSRVLVFSTWKGVLELIRQVFSHLPHLTLPPNGCRCNRLPAHFGSSVYLHPPLLADAPGLLAV